MTPTPLRRYAALLATYLRPLWRQVALLALLLFGNIGLQLYSPQVLRRFLDTALAGSALRPLGVLAGIFLAVAVVQQIVTVIVAFVAARTGWTATNALRGDLMLHCLRLDMPFHHTHTPGELIERIDGDVTSLTNFFSQFILLIVGNGCLLIGVLVLAAQENWRVGVVFGIFVLAALFSFLRVRELVVPHWVTARKSAAQLFSFLEERLGGIEDIRSSGAVAYMMGRLHLLLRGYLVATRRVTIFSQAMLSTSRLLLGVSNVAALGIGTYLFVHDVASLGTVYLLYAYSNMLVAPLNQISQQIEDVQKAGAAIRRADELLHTQSALVDGTRTLPAGALAVECRELRFSYGERTVLDDLTWQLAPGKVLGLLGRTGSGKSTLTRLLFRMYDPTGGAVLVGGVDTRDTRLDDIRERVGLVTQDVQLFHASIRDNLSFFDPTVPDAQMIAALHDLGLGSWYAALPAGLDTLVSPGGTGLSAGEAQLLAFARVMLKNPGLVILDEASSRLDPATEQLIERAIERLLHGRTGIIIAHRLATVARADEIMILEDGRIVEHDTRTRLADAPDSHFAHLLRTGLAGVLA